MLTRENWKLITFIIVIFLLAVSWGWMTSSEGLCGLRVRDAPKPHETLLCVEFWFNRYIGVVATFLAAGIGAWWVRVQVLVTQQQFAAAAIEGLKGRVQELIEMRDAMRRYYVSLVRLHSDARSQLGSFHASLERLGSPADYRYLLEQLEIAQRATTLRSERDQAYERGAQLMKIRERATLRITTIDVVDKFHEGTGDLLPFVHEVIEAFERFANAFDGHDLISDVSEPLKKILAIRRPEATTYSAFWPHEINEEIRRLEKLIERNLVRIEM